MHRFPPVFFERNVALLGEQFASSNCKLDALVTEAILTFDEEYTVRPVKPWVGQGCKTALRQCLCSRRARGMGSFQDESIACR